MPTETSPETPQSPALARTGNGRVTAGRRPDALRRGPGRPSDQELIEAEHARAARLCQMALDQTPEPYQSFMRVGHTKPLIGPPAGHGDGADCFCPGPRFPGEGDDSRMRDHGRGLAASRNASEVGGRYLGIPPNPVLEPPAGDRKEVAESILIHQLTSDRQLVQFTAPGGHFGGN